MEHHRRRGRGQELVNRLAERRALEGIMDAVRAGESRVLVLFGDPGTGKTALLDYLADHAAGCRVVRGTGVQSEMELAFAALHQLLSPLLDYLDHLPVPQREALRATFGLTNGRAPDRLLVGLAVLGLLSEAAGERPLICLVDDVQWLDRASALRQAASAFARADTPVEDALRWGWLATTANETLWDYGGWRATARQIQLARDAGALDQLPFLLNALSMNAVLSGDFGAAASLIAEADTVFEATGSPIAPYAAVMLASLRGREIEASQLIQSTIEETAAREHGSGATWAYWAAAVLYNGLSRHQEALAAARDASEHGHVYVSVWVLPELIEAAARTGSTRIAVAALDRLAESTQAGGTEDGLGIEARSRALLSPAESAQAHYREAISRLGHARRRPDLARAHLLYGEWLRRERRRAEAREQLRTALQMLDEMGIEAFAERARRELSATGETVTRRAVPATRARAAGTREALTAQEVQVARLARDGLSNPEIAGRLFISARTVQHHLSRVFAKLGISSRGQLRAVLPE